MGNQADKLQTNQTSENETLYPEDVEIPADLVDPITKEIMLEPVIVLASMKTYDKKTINRWIDSKRAYDPLTGIPLTVGSLPVLLRPREDIAARVTNLSKQIHNCLPSLNKMYVMILT